MPDVNSDGKPDLVVANKGSNGCVDPDQSIQAGQALAFSSTAADGLISTGSRSARARWSTVVGDYNGDEGKPDIVVKQQPDPITSWYCRESAGGFFDNAERPEGDISVGDRPWLKDAVRQLRQ